MLNVKTYAHRLCPPVALRVSTVEQNLNLQIDTLKEAICEKIITDTVSGARVERAGLARAGSDPETHASWFTFLKSTY